MRNFPFPTMWAFWPLLWLLPLRRLSRRSFLSSPARSSPWFLFAWKLLRATCWRDLKRCLVQLCCGDESKQTERYLAVVNMWFEEDLMIVGTKRSSNAAFPCRGTALLRRFQVSWADDGRWSRSATRPPLVQRGLRRRRFFSKAERASITAPLSLCTFLCANFNQRCRRRPVWWSFTCRRHGDQLRIPPPPKPECKPNYGKSNWLQKWVELSRRRTIRHSAYV